MILMMMRRSYRVMSVYRVHVQLIGHAIAGVLAETVVGLNRRRWLHSGQVSVRLPTVLARAVSSSLRLSLTVRRRQLLIVVRTATGTR